MNLCFEVDDGVVKAVMRWVLIPKWMVGQGWFLLCTRWAGMDIGFLPAMGDGAGIDMEI